MTLNPLYELRERLGASAIAGVGLMKEDFRLARAVEQMQTLASVSPIFDKIYKSAVNLIGDGPDKATSLMDLIGVIDAVLCTQAASDIKGDIEPIALIEGAKYNDINYSQLQPLIHALSNSGSGRYEIINEFINDHSKLIQDFRVIPLLIKGLGDNFSDIGTVIKDFLSRQDKMFVPFLKRGLDPQGKREMALRVQAISSIAKESENDFYLELLETAKKNVREEAIKALRFKQDNLQKILNLTKSEKGDCKKAAQYALAFMDDPQAVSYWEKQLSENPSSCIGFLRFKNADWISDRIADTAGSIIDEFLALPDYSEMNHKKIDDLITCLLIGLGKNSDKLCDVYRKVFANYDKLANKLFSDINSKQFTIRLIGYSAYYKHQVTIPKAFDWMLHDSIVRYANDKLIKLAYELLEGKDFYQVHSAFTAALIDLTPQQTFEKFSPIVGKYLKIIDKKETFVNDFEALKNCIYELHLDTEKGAYLAQQYSDFYDNVTITHRQYISNIDPRWYREFITYCEYMLDHSFKQKYRGTLNVDSLAGNFSYRIGMLFDNTNEELNTLIRDYIYKQIFKSSNNTYSLIRQLSRTHKKDCTGILLHYAKSKNAYSNLLISLANSNSFPLDFVGKYKEMQEIYDFITTTDIKNESLNPKTIKQWLDENKQEMENLNG